MNMPTKEEKLAKLENLFKISTLQTLASKALTKDEFLKLFAQVLKVVKDVKDTNQREWGLIYKAIDVLSKKVKEDSNADLAEIKRQVKDITEKALKEQAISLNVLKDSVARMRKGKDGHDGIDAALPIKGVDYFDGTPGLDGADAPLPTNEELLALITPLVGELEKRVGDKINTLPRGGARSSHSTRFTDLSSKTNGVLKVFSVPESLSGVLFSSDFPTVLMEGNGYTLNKSRTQLTMTTDTAPSAASQLLYQSTDIENHY
jgi:hypothetical protein